MIAPLKAPKLSYMARLRRLFSVATTVTFYVEAENLPTGTAWWFAYCGWENPDTVLETPVLSPDEIGTFANARNLSSIHALAVDDGYQYLGGGDDWWGEYTFEDGATYILDFATLAVSKKENGYTPPPPPPPQLVAPIPLVPTDGSELMQRRPLFDWDPVIGTGVAYLFQLANEGTFSDPLISVNTSNHTQYTPTFDLPEGIYFWRVFATRGTEVGPSSNIRHFYILPLAPIPEPSFSAIEMRAKPSYSASGETPQWTAWQAIPADFAVLEVAEDQPLSAEIRFTIDIPASVPRKYRFYAKIYDPEKNYLPFGGDPANNWNIEKEKKITGPTTWVITLPGSLRVGVYYTDRLLLAWSEPLEDGPTTRQVYHEEEDMLLCTVVGQAVEVAGEILELKYWDPKSKTWQDNISVYSAADDPGLKVRAIVKNTGNQSAIFFLRTNESSFHHFERMGPSEEKTKEARTIAIPTVEATYTVEHELWAKYLAAGDWQEAHNLDTATAEGETDAPPEGWKPPAFGDPFQWFKELTGAAKWIAIAVILVVILAIGFYIWNMTRAARIVGGR